ncbi:MAG: hypothetical protein KDA94_10485, partial [Acidimicrobiales bacterium]|nr:hypothetical protein [Acidimicrobiales bacterium]
IAPEGAQPDPPAEREVREPAGGAVSAEAVSAEAAGGDGATSPSETELAMIGAREDFVIPDDAQYDPWEAPARRNPVRTTVAVLVVLLVAAAAIALLGRGDDSKATTDTSEVDAATTVGTIDESSPASLVRSFCGDPRPLGSSIATFEPGAVAVGFAPIPDPTSSTQEGAEVVLQVSPEVGEPTLQLDASVALVSVGICLEETGAEGTGTSCAYELTNTDDLGEDASSELQAVTYEATAYALSTGEALTTGTIVSDAQACPEFAFTDGDGVSNPITGADVATWVRDAMPGGIPAAN